MKKGSKRHGYQLKNKYKKSLRNNLLKEILLLSKDNVESLSYTLPVLKCEDVLFQGSNNYCDANINNTYSNNEVLISQGYISTAILLLRVIKYSNSNLVKDSYIFPSLFCFRQYLELIMKDSILKYRNGRNELSKGECNLGTHNLLGLWNDLKTYFDKQDNVTKNVERLIKELYSYDDNGEAFRYDYKLNDYENKISSVKINKFVDIDLLLTRMLQLYRFFECINSDAYRCQEDMCNE